MTFLSLILLIMGIIIVGLLYFQTLISFVDFFILCSSKKISSRSVLLIWPIAKRNKERNQITEVFENGDFLNRCILDVTKQKNSQAANSKRWNDFSNLLDILYEIRQLLSTKAASTMAVLSSVDVPEDSVLTLTVLGLGGAEYHSRVLSNNDSGMIISYPAGPKLPMNFTWRSQQALVKFTIGGANFRFAMTFDPDYVDQSFSTLCLLHSDSFSQEQKPSNTRYNVHIPAMFSLLESNPNKSDESHQQGAQENESAEPQPVEHRSVVKDLSLGSCRILVGGTVPPNAKCKLMLRLNGQHILVEGKTQISEYIESDDFSYVNIQFTYINREDLRKICSFIYGVEVADKDIPPTPQENSGYYQTLSQDISPLGTSELSTSTVPPAANNIESQNHTASEESNSASEDLEKQIRTEQVADFNVSGLSAADLDQESSKGLKTETNINAADSESLALADATRENTAGIMDRDEDLEKLLEKLYETNVASADRAEAIAQNPPVLYEELDSTPTSSRRKR